MFRSKVEMERIRGLDAKLTNWVNGRTIVYIEKPKKSQSRRVKIGMFMTSLYYPGMIISKKCFKCYNRVTWPVMVMKMRK